MQLRRLIPMRPWCALVLRHCQKRYSAHLDGKLMVVYTCRCGQRQSAKLLPANRKFRRAVARSRTLGRRLRGL